MSKLIEHEQCKEQPEGKRMRTVESSTSRNEEKKKDERKEENEKYRRETIATN